MGTSPDSHYARCLPVSRGVLRQRQGSEILVPQCGTRPTIPQVVVYIYNIGGAKTCGRESTVARGPAQNLRTADPEAMLSTFLMVPHANDG